MSEALIIATRARSTVRRRITLVLLLIAGAVALVAAYSISQMLWAVHDVRNDFSAVETGVGAGDLAAATAGLRSLETTSANLREITGGGAWGVVARAPWIGPTVQGLHQMAESINVLAVAAAPIAEGIQAAPTNSERIAALANAGRQIDTLIAATRTAEASMAQVRPDQMLFGTGEQAARLQESVASLASRADSAAEAMVYLPQMVGADGPRTWLVMLQNPAEARGSGGLFAAYAIVRMDKGVPTIVEAASRRDGLDNAQIPYQQVTEGSRPSNVWGEILRTWASSNLSLDFPTVAQLAAAGMAARGTPVDGVIAVDPSILAAVLTGTGPVKSGDISVDGANAVEFFTKGLYEDFPGYPDVQAKDKLVMALLYGTVDSLAKRPLNLPGLWLALEPAVAEGHLRVWSADPAEEAWLVGTVAGAEVPNTPGPVVGVALNNGSGGKLDAYMKTEIDYQVGICEPIGPAATPVPGTVAGQVSVTLTNESPDGLPPYVDQRLDNPEAEPGSTVMIVSIYGPVGATDGIVLDGGAPALFATGTERGRPVWTTTVQMAQYDTATVTAQFRQPNQAGAAPEVITQSMARPPAISTSTGACATP